MRKGRIGTALFAILLSVMVFGRPAAAESDIWSQLHTYTDETLALTGAPIEHAVVQGNIVYQYQKETDSFSARYITGNNGSSMKIESYVLGRPVTKIDTLMFEGTGSWVTELVLPETLREPLHLDEEGPRIQTLVFPYGMTEPGIVSGVPSLKKVVLPETAVSSGKFSDCKALKQVSLPTGLKKVEDWAFARCTSLSELKLPKSVTEIGQGAFAGCRKLELYVPESVQKIGKNAFGTGKTGKIKMLYCVKNSAAHKYAKKNKISFILVKKNVFDQNDAGSRPGNVSKLKAKKTGKKVTLSWKAVKGANGYEVWRSKTENGNYVRVSSKKAVKCTVKADQKYYYKVRAYKKVGKQKIYGGFSGIRV